LIDLIDKVAKSDAVRGVVIDIDSPGGASVGGEAVYEAVRRLSAKKPTVAYIGSLGASAAYMIALGADRIVARRTALTASIGVIAQWPDVSRLLDTIGVKMEEVKSAPLKAEPNPFKPASPEAKAMLDSAKLDLEYTVVRAPIDGRVSRALLTEGNYVSGNAGNASLLTTVVSVDPVYVIADIDEDTLLKFNQLVHDKKLGDENGGRVPVALQLADENDYPRQGYIESFDNQLNPDTGSILMRAVFANTDGMIVPGLFARIRLPLSENHPALLVDERAIGTDQAQKFVLTLTATNTVQYRPVELGPVIDGKRIVRSGLTAGEKIVVNGLSRVRPGMPVTPQDETPAVQTALK